MRRIVPLVMLVCCRMVLVAGTQSAPERYRDALFSSHQLVSDIRYGAFPERLLDLYGPPVSDTVLSRPLVIYIHGGGFKSQTKVGTFQTRICTTLARAGYVVASLEYRLTKALPDDASYFEALLRAMQDAKSAVRFLRNHAAQYGIDPKHVIVTGSSAGSITALHLAYLDSAHVPTTVRWANVGGVFDDERENAGSASNVQGVVNCWGAIGDTAWMRGSNVPVFSVHGAADTLVYFDRVPSYHGFRFGSRQIGDAARRLGIKHGERIYSETGHTLDNSAVKQETAIRDIITWLSENLRVRS